MSKTTKQPDAIADLTKRLELVERAIHEKLQRQREHDATVAQHRGERDYHKSLDPLRHKLFDEFVKARLDRTLDPSLSATFCWCAVQCYRRWITARIETIVDEHEREHASLSDDEFKAAMLALGDIEIVVEKNRRGARHEAFQGVCIALEFRDTKNDIDAEEHVRKNVGAPELTPEQVELAERHAKARYPDPAPRCGKCREVVTN